MRMTKEEKKKIEHAVKFNREKAENANNSMRAANAAGDFKTARMWSATCDEWDAQFEGLRLALRAIGYTTRKMGDEWRVVSIEAGKIMDEIKDAVEYGAKAR